MGFAMNIIVDAFLVPSGSFPKKNRKEEVGAVMLWREEQIQEVNNKLKPSLDNNHWHIFWQWQKIKVFLKLFLSKNVGNANHDLMDHHSTIFVHWKNHPLGGISWITATANIQDKNGCRTCHLQWNSCGLQMIPISYDNVRMFILRQQLSPLFLIMSCNPFPKILNISLGSPHSWKKHLLIVPLQEKKHSIFTAGKVKNHLC